ncbi:patatin-like phospholipase family protein [Phaeobacter sp. QD34_3]|uniref:patatin-like phospholipase family protein n=1 Tax=unclassified Phaeobacter TaxID=2621772 RepID=UPI00237FC78B|nr:MULTISPECIES: patatin-like phospholipase family protein [unclassified Phaeobacter]MDE4135056.1 patatin-like phospholipase family protein [Phaeobacter sp. QD34_3]MDE4138686.1 patatin-like phospholipase family protein [Phaeobacter sp. QD34_24]
MNSDQKAAEAFLAEMRTRLATQPLPFKHGDETAALGSLFSLFGLAREIIKANPGCREFADLADEILNTDIRPFTARWQKFKEDGHLQTRNGAVDFRAGLVEIQGKLNGRIGMLWQMAYGEEEQEEAHKVEAAFAARSMLLKTAERPFAPETVGVWAAGEPEDEEQPPMVFGIPENKLIDDETTALINNAEAREIRTIRDANGKAKGARDSPITDAAGLAFSGGGIRSATFCLGVAQVLADKGLFKDFDIMSTVSGGGYTGAFITRRLGDRPLEPGTSRKDIFGSADGPDTDEIAYVRTRASYLSMVSPLATFVAACRLLGGTLHNWSAPAFVIAVLVWISLAVSRWGRTLTGRRSRFSP